MRPSALLVPLLILALPLGIMAGCGGGGSHECSEELLNNGEDNTVYAGDYTATFTPTDGDAANTIGFTLKAATTGFITGTVSDPGASSGTIALGQNSVVAKGHCDGGKTYVKLRFQRSVSAEPEQLNVTADTLTTLSGASVAAKLTTGGITDKVAGTLTISSATQ